MTADIEFLRVVLWHLYGGIGWRNTRLSTDDIKVLHPLMDSLYDSTLSEQTKTALIRRDMEAVRNACNECYRLEEDDDFYTIVGVRYHAIIGLLDAIQAANRA